jgi:capsular polysaccharide biosynthesis protein
VSILDRPSPARLVWPQTRVIAGAALLLGLLVGGLLAFMIEYFDDTVKTAADVEQTLGTITLGRIPRPLVLLTPVAASDTTSGRLTERAR